MAINITIPTSWNNLTNTQLKQMAKLLFTPSPTVVFDYKVFKILLNAKWWQLLKRRKLNKTLQNVGLSTLKQYYSWVYHQVNLTRFLPKLKINCTTYYGPHNRINNITINQFAHAEDLYLGWCNTKNIEYLQYLAAVLYQAKKNKQLTVFNKENLEAKAKHFTKVPTPTLLAILLSYQGCRNHLISKYPLIFPKPKKQTKNAPLSSGFGKLILHNSGAKFGTYNETANANVYTFLNEFTEQLKNTPKHA